MLSSNIMVIVRGSGENKAMQCTEKWDTETAVQNLHIW